LNLRKYLE